MSKYVGRILAIGKNHRGRVVALYRVSSRSFPNRYAQVGENRVAILPRAGSEKEILGNPYVAYYCLRIIGDFVVVSNGSQTEPIAEKIFAGMSPRDAVALSLLTLDYEKDKYKTPRLAGVIKRATREAILGIVKENELIVKRLALEKGYIFYIATYEADEINIAQKEVCEINSAEEGARYMVEFGVFSKFSHPVATACALEDETKFQIEVYNP
jgi:IMP cyclohydrolase